MTYRTASLENGISPAELLMYRKINTTLPQAKMQLKGKKTFRCFKINHFSSVLLKVIK